MSWITLRLRVETPIFCGDSPSVPAQIRVSSIRGCMHFWLRAMAGFFVKSDPYALRKIENHVLGSTKFSSPVRIRIPEQPRHTKEDFPYFMPRSREHPYNKWIGYLLGQGLSTWQHKDQNGTEAIKVKHSFISPGEEFEIKIKFTNDDQDIKNVALGALWLGLTFGGIGARTRRGFGSVRITHSEGPLPPGWNHADLLSPNLEFYQKTNRIWFTGNFAPLTARSLRKIKEKNEIELFDRSDSVPNFPILSKSGTTASITGGKPFLCWEDVLAFAGKELRYFRASKNRTPTRKNYTPEIKTNEWLNSIGGDKDENFPLAGLGLPIIFDRGYAVHAGIESSSGIEKIRRASPLWIKAVGEGDSWHLFSFSFLDRFLPKNASVHLWTKKTKKQERTLKTTTKDSHDKVHRWIEGMRGSTGEVFVRDASEHN